MDCLASANKNRKPNINCPALSFASLISNSPPEVRSAGPPLQSTEAPSISVRSAPNEPNRIRRPRLARRAGNSSIYCNNRRTSPPDHHLIAIINSSQNQQSVAGIVFSHIKTGRSPCRAGLVLTGNLEDKRLSKMTERTTENQHMCIHAYPFACPGCRNSLYLKPKIRRNKPNLLAEQKR